MISIPVCCARVSISSGGSVVPRLALVILAAALFVVALPRTASAFERQWHLGAGLGWVVPKDAYTSGPAVALHLAYGISDMFDARVEVRSSLHDLEAPASSASAEERALGGGRNSFSQAMVGLAYKVDVIEWVPYLGVRAGYYRFGATPPLAKFPIGKEYARQGGSLGTMLGVDYAFSRSAAIGAEVDYDTLLPRGGAFSASLHVEYRWGF